MSRQWRIRAKTNDSPLQAGYPNLLQAGVGRLPEGSARAAGTCIEAVVEPNLPDWEHLSISPRPHLAPDEGPPHLGMAPVSM